MADVSLVLVSDEGTTGYVDRPAVRADQRNRGLARALPVDSFAAVRRQRHHHLRAQHRLRTGALGLYERVRMVVDQVWVNRGITLT